MTQTYTEAKDQLLMALAEIPWQTRLEGAPFGSTNVLAAAALAVLEEEKNGKSDAKFIEANRDYWFQKFEREQAELAELKRRVERALKESRDSVCNYPCPHYSCETHTRYAQILGGKDKP